MQHTNSALKFDPCPGQVSASEQPEYRIFLAGSDHESNAQLASFLSSEGHSVWQACSSEQLAGLYAGQQPDLVLLDIERPIAGNHDPVSLLKSHAGKVLIPVIFMITEADSETAAGYLTVGDDIIRKPCIRPLLVAKIQALMRIRALYAELESQKDALEYHRQIINTEQETARRLFDKFMHSDVLGAPGISYMLSAMGMFNGDLLLAAYKPTGGLRIMAGDMTGHGLSAAVGAVPASEIFYTMTAKGYSVSDILIEINSKLKRILPTGHFCAASVVEFECNRQQIAVWNGGMPDILLFDNERQLLKERIGSCALPLGIIDSEALNTSVVYVDIMPGDHLYLCSDGVTEARNTKDEMYGQQRLIESIRRQERRDDAFDGIKQDFDVFTTGAQISDDTTLVEITCTRGLVEHSATEQQRPVERVPTRWSVQLRLDADALKVTDPRPLLTQLVMDLQGMQKHRDRLFTILAELFSNALEHGVLGLDSRLKASHTGFVEYYKQRTQELDALESGWISIALEHIPRDGRGELQITVEDSGSGFDYQNSGIGLEENMTQSGRGIALVRSLCRGVVFEGKGNRVRAAYAWDNADTSAGI